MKNTLEQSAAIAEPLFGATAQVNNVVVTGFGSVSSVGVKTEQIWAALGQGRGAPDQGAFDQGASGQKETRSQFFDTSLAAPYICHPACPVDAAEYIESKTTRHLLGLGQLHAIVAVDEALQSAGYEKDSDGLRHAALILACGEGNRDDKKDAAMAAASLGQSGAELDQLLNQHFSRCRPGTFLAGLPNLNSHHVAAHFNLQGESITCTGDELAGMNALKLACRKIANGDVDTVIVGGTSYGTKRYLLEYAALQGKLCNSPFKEVWFREDEQLCVGTGAAFLVLESQRHACARHAPNLFHIKAGSLASCNRSIDFAAESGLLDSATAQLGALLSMAQGSSSAVISSSCGNGALSRAELAVLDRVQRASDCPLALRSATNYTGALSEAALPFGLVLACMSLFKGELCAPFNRQSELECNGGVGERETILTSILVNCWGADMGEASILLERM